MATRDGRMRCGLCNIYIDEAKYRVHVMKCGLRDDEDEVQPVLKVCPLCGKQVKDLVEHCQRCTGGDSPSNYTYNDGRSSRVPPVRQPPRTNVSNRASTKQCPVCSERIADDDYTDHVDSCGVRSSSKPTVKKNTKECPICSKRIAANEYTDHVDECNAESSPKPTVKKNTKECPICSKRIAANEYTDHVDECNAESSPKPTVKKNTKECPICSKRIAANEYTDHVDECNAESSPKPTVKKNTKECPICSKRIAANEYTDHVDECNAESSPKPTVKKNTKECPVCLERIAANDYADHVDNCGVRSSSKPTVKKNTKECPICSKRIAANEYIDHVDECSARSSTKQTIPKGTSKCIICFKAIAESDYQRHVNACLEGSSTSGNRKPLTRSAQKSCFTCSSPIELSKGSSHTTPCRAHHIYCLKCLQRSMNEYIQSNTAPVCHSTLCDYEFSRYDIECLPLEAGIIKRLLTLVKSTQRPQCPFCLFYVDFNTMNDFEKHAASCSTANLVPCEYCHCLYNMNRLDDHTRQCRNIPPSEQQKALIDFIISRTKYPVTAQQIRVFLEHRKRSRLPLDPHAIVDALAEFDGVFPFEIPTRDCDICAESYVYDDIFVFGCEESHKLCYGCFAESCTSKMKNNEVLACAMCAYQLQDGELKQLRVSADQKRQFLEYQTQKTFSAYTGTQGVIKCPTQKCKWVAEMQNPNDRFLVQCPLCQYEFCSLCNQQYHFRTTCQQIPELTQRWFFWCNTERGNYWQARAQQDANFRAQLEDFERQRTANVQRNAELQQRYNELLADETYKAQNCRLCPKCGRVVQHLGGCDLMVCGHNYHGGNDQSGCGHGFCFSQAPPYAPIANTGPQQVRNDLPTPAQQQAIVHEGVKCDACQNDVQGIRFDCVHCSSLIFCEKCEQRSTLEHSNQVRDQHKQQHVFQLIARPLNANNSQ